MKKIGFLVMAVVLAIGALGVGYAAWTDEVTITGTVNTGSVDLEIVDTSNTTVWKVAGEPGSPVIDVQHWWCSDGAPAMPANAVDAFPNDGEADMDPVATATSTDTSDTSGKSISIVIDNAFPLTDELRADFLLHYNGTIPVKVDVAELSATDNDNDAHSILDDVLIKFYESDADGTMGTLIGDASAILGDQWHQCEYILVVIWVDLSEQDPDDMLQIASINGRIHVIQWNEYSPS